MSSRYEPIPTDFENEVDHVSETAPNTEEDDARSDRTRSTDRTHFFQQDAMDTDDDPEEEPDEDIENDNPPSTDSQTPLLATNPEITPPARRTARIRVTGPNPGEWTRIRPPTPDPRTANLRMWGRTLRTLQRWRDNAQYPHVPEEGSSNVRQEFLMDTTPIVVDKLARHEEKLDRMEDILMDMPGDEAFGNIQHQLNDAEDNISYLNDNVRSLKMKVESLTRDFSNMKATMEGKVDESLAMAHGAMGQIAHMMKPKDYHKKKKEGDDEWQY